eukprot:g6994.t1
MKKSAEKLASFADMFDETGFIGKWLNKKVDALDQKAAKLQAEMEGKKILGTTKEEKTQGEVSGGGFDDDGSGLEKLGVLGAANLKMKMKRFSKIAHQNQASQSVGDEGVNESTNYGGNGDLWSNNDGVQQEGYYDNTTGDYEQGYYQEESYTYEYENQQQEGRN